MVDVFLVVILNPAAVCMAGEGDVCHAQSIFRHENDSLVYGVSFPVISLQADRVDTARYHSPRKALTFSAILPGLGQVYNGKYWKIPIVYGAGGAFVYFFRYNQIKYKKFRDAYVNGDPQKEAFIDGRYYSYDILPRGRDYYRRYRDLSLLGAGLIYLLNIVDAMIDAHFFYYDVSEDLSLRLEPVMLKEGLQPATVGFQVHIGF